MKIEEEIKSKFSNDYQKLAVNIMFTHGWLLQLQNELLKKYDISVQQYNILRILRGSHPEPATVTLLKERMLDKMSDASRLVERLRVKELLKREYCEHDRRRSDITITKRGLDLLNEIDKHQLTFEKKLQKLSTDEAISLNTLLDKLRG